MANQHYSEDFKQAAVQKAFSPGTISASSVARNLGVPSSTLFQWKEKYGSRFIMEKRKDRTLASNWSNEEKLEAINKTYSMTENEVGEYLRSKGLNACDLEAFKKDFLTSLTSRGRPRLDPEVVKLRKDNSELKRDLNKKNEALAEMSARVILLKKSRLLWGVPEDEE